MCRKLLVILFVPFLMLCAEEPAFQSRLYQNLHFNSRHILVLEDNSIWEAFPLQKNSRTWGEWWNSLEVDQPNDWFLFDLTSWNLSSCINVYKKAWVGSELSGVYRNNQEGLKTCEYLLENHVTHELVFARPINLGSLIQYFYRYADSEYARGHSNGYSKGYTYGYHRGKADSNNNKKH